MSVTAESRLAALAAGQWGMLTAAQAGAEGIARSTLARREKAGTLERMRQGVYRLPGVPPDRLDDIRAAWLASDPATVARDRLLAHDVVVVGGAAAAWSHHIGDLYPAPYLLYTPKRRQSAHEDVRYSRRHLPKADVMILDGLPITTRERTIADLLDEGDLSLVADALRDAERSGDDLDIPVLIRHLDTHAKRLGHASGSDLYAELRTLAGVDVARLRGLVISTDLTERLSAELGKQMQQALAPILYKLNAQVGAMIPDLLGPVQKQLDDQAEQILAPIRTQLDDQVRRMTAPTNEALSGYMPVSLPRVKLPSSALPKITLPPATQAMLRDLARPAVPILGQKPEHPAPPQRREDAETQVSNEDDE
jgi:predicted transcriptional regulator of viral defense system